MPALTVQPASALSVLVVVAVGADEPERPR